MFNPTDKMNTTKSKIFKGNKQAYFSPVHMNLCRLKLSQIRVAQFPSTAPLGISAPMMSDVQSASFHFTTVTLWASVEQSVTENKEGNGVDESIMDHEQDFSTTS